MIIVNSWKPLTAITKRSILDIAAGLDPPPISSLLSSVVAWCKNWLTLISVKNVIPNAKLRNKISQYLKNCHKNYLKLFHVRSSWTPSF